MDHLQDYYIPDEETPRRVDVLALVSGAFILFMIFNLLRGRGPAETATGGQAEVISAGEVSDEDKPLPLGDPGAFAAPYDEYRLTQGPHGASYGHKAIDIAAGKGATIKSPVNGFVSDKYVDEYGNPTLVIENENYVVTMLHGKYDVGVGDPLQVGDPVGRESNLGYTTDMQGRSCKNRNCGYHTHLNVYDKTEGANANPLDLLGMR